MTPEQAKSIAALVGHSFRAPPETIVALAFSLKGFDYSDMNSAAQKAIMEYDRMPSVKALLGIYYGIRRAGASTGPGRSSVPCAYCQDAGGWRLKPGGPLFPPGAALPPYDGMTQHTDEGGKALGPAWPHRPACPAHAEDQLWADGLARKGEDWTYRPREGMDPEWRASCYQGAGMLDPGPPVKWSQGPGPLAGMLPTGSPQEAQEGA